MKLKKIREILRLTDWNFLEMVPPQIEEAEAGEVADLNGQVGDFVAAGVQLHQGLHFAELLGKADQSVVVDDKALEGKLADAGRQVAQLISAEVQKSQGLQVDNRVRNRADRVVVEHQSF